MMKQCNTCNIEKEESLFPKNGTDNDGKTRRRPDCNVCYTIKRKLDKQKHSKFVNNTKHRTGEEDTYTLKDWKDAMIFFGGRCAYCDAEQSRRKKLTRDHVLAVSKGGGTVKENIVPSCHHCNCSKGDIKMEVWFARQKFFTSERIGRINEWRGELNVKSSTSTIKL